MNENEDSYITNNNEDKTETTQGETTKEESIIGNLNKT